MIIAKIFLILFYIFIFLLALILLIALIPFSYSVILNIYNRDVKGNISIKILKGFIRIMFLIEEKYYILSIFGKTIISGNMDNNIKNGNKDKDKEKKENKRKNEHNKRHREKINKREIEIKEMILIIKEFIIKVFEQIKPREFNLYGRYGFENPATTGIVSGVISVLNAFKSYAINLYPTFTETIIDADIEVEGQISLMSLIIIFISTIIKKPVRKLVFRKKVKTEVII